MRIFLDCSFSFDRIGFIESDNIVFWVLYLEVVEIVRVKFCRVDCNFGGKVSVGVFTFTFMVRLLLCVRIEIYRYIVSYFNIVFFYFCYF